MKKVFFFTLLSLLFVISLNAQLEQQYEIRQNAPVWVQMMYNNPEDPEEVIKAYTAYYNQHEFIKNKHTQYYKRWLRSISRSDILLPYGKDQPRKNKENIDDYLSRSLALQQLKSPTSEWECIGPFDFDIEAAGRSYAPGAAHVYTVERAFSNHDVLYAGTATAGMWKSTDGGENWTLLTQNILIGGIKSIEIDPTNPNVVYFGASGSLCKTTNGGNSWVIMGTSTLGSNHDINDIVTHPENHEVLFLSSNQGLFKTTNAGEQWETIMTGSFQEIEFHPANPNIIYTIKQVDNKTEFYKSVDGGITFATIANNGWPFPPEGAEQKRVEIAVTPADSNRIYALATGSVNGGSGLYGIYVSEDAGDNWSFRCCGEQPGGEPAEDNINMMGWDKNGLDDGGQYYYDLALAVDPENADKVHVAGVNQWISNDGGYTFTCPAKWSEPAEPGYVHADIHDIRYYEDEIWAACDGGIFISTDDGSHFTKKMAGIAGSDFWGFGAGFHGNIMLGGAYHNGTLLKDEDTYINGWICTGGGDGVRGFVNFGNNRLAYDDREGRILTGNREADFGYFEFDLLPNSSYIVGESSDMTFDPRFYNTIYTGHETELVKTTNNGKTFETIHDFGAKVTSIEIPWGDPQTIYVVTYAGWWDAKKIWRSNDGGNSWTEITPPSSLLNGNEWVPWDISVSSNNPDIIWAARTSQYGDTNLDGHRVYQSTNGGTTWLNITTPVLDGEAITNIVHQKGTDGGVYLGTRRAVYYKNNTLSDWELFNANLPLNTFSTKLVPYYWGNQLRNATNRSVYEVELYEHSNPMAQISVDKTRLNCFDNTVQFVDHSVLDGNSATWSWSFPGGIPETSTEQNPVVTYDIPGSYAVSLVVTDEFGTSSQAYTDFIHFEDHVEAPDFSEDFEAGLDEYWILYNANNSFNWNVIDINTGVDCAPTQCMYVDHFNINQPNHEAELITPNIDLTNMKVAILHYDYAYARWGSGYEDGFRVDISTDCGQSWSELYYAFGTDLTTIEDQSDWWQPGDCSEWSVDNMLDLSDFTGSIVNIRFVAINGWGNNFFLDNVNITDLMVGTEEVNISSRMEVFPNPSKGNFYVRHNMENAELSLIGMDGKLILNQKTGKEKIPFDLELPQGVYQLQLKNGQEILTKRLVVSGN
ncbi:MAG: T9SS type A sorting domain-containing protein [Saprospiraceae bacterium]|nr:T9SS type A sorting domain-containing protein [Saprospiraceae bacterium]MCB9322655.1 T9SS type A sorting domain-containing protein [Lewinellaceae bacterium]